VKKVGMFWCWLVVKNIKKMKKKKKEKEKKVHEHSCSVMLLDKQTH
jgi:hypothetical protein